MMSTNYVHKQLFSCYYEKCLAMEGIGVHGVETAHNRTSARSLDVGGGFLHRLLSKTFYHVKNARTRYMIRYIMRGLEIEIE